MKKVFCLTVILVISFNHLFAQQWHKASEMRREPEYEGGARSAAGWFNGPDTVLVRFRVENDTAIYCGWKPVLRKNGYYIDNASTLGIFYDRGRNREIRNVSVYYFSEWAECGYSTDFPVDDSPPMSCLPFVEEIVRIDSICENSVAIDSLVAKYKKQELRVASPGLAASGNVLRIYPNPATRGKFINIILYRDGEIAMYDIAGKLILAQPGVTGFNQLIIPFSCATGVYMLRHWNTALKIVVEK